MNRLLSGMEGVLVDFVSGLTHIDVTAKLRYIDQPQDTLVLFFLMHPLTGAFKAITLLAKHYDVYILSTVPWKKSSAWSDKVT